MAARRHRDAPGVRRPLQPGRRRAIALLFIYHKEVGLQYTTETAIYLVAMFAIGAIWWAVARSMRRGQGIDLALAYKEIPPE